ncbi:MAG TPA: hypothetical protein VF661_11080, partial [Actinomycetales bacterium]
MSTTPVLHLELLALLEKATGTAAERIDSALRVLLESLHLDVAFVGEFEDGDRVITALASVEGVDAAQLPPVGTAHPVGETLCRLVTEG